MNISNKIEILSHAPALLRELINDIPKEITKNNIISRKWSIHEHACHLADVQSMIIERFKSFKKEQQPEFQAFLPGTNVSDEHLVDMDLEQSLHSFETERKS